MPCVCVCVMTYVRVKGLWDTCFFHDKCGGGIDGHRVEMDDEVRRRRERTER